jgi:hypothetical protein
LSGGRAGKQTKRQQPDSKSKHDSPPQGKQDTAAILLNPGNPIRTSDGLPKNLRRIRCIKAKKKLCHGTAFTPTSSGLARPLVSGKT